MAYGLSTYAFFWRVSERAPKPLTPEEMLTRTRELGGDVFQFCDYPLIGTLGDARLAAIRAQADEAGIALELGTRGVRPGHLRRYLELADRLGARFVRTMLNTADHRPTVAEAVALLAETVPRYAERGVTLGLETYEQVATADLLAVVRGVGSPHLGVCLDPANSVARLERPADVIDATAPYVVNIHVKDFAFTRRDGWVGFTLAGCPLGEGLLDYRHLITAVRPADKGISQIVEHWLPWQGDYASTAELEARWTEHSINTLTRSRSN
ncbi:sugar phosphate isomerase/epimerase family protein [Streptomyces litchfieldiae]|uniref:Sugar phosphate isomerase/epimerase family protein n=1 Tax=Streptomyces litchfieldiae TaxID=3075543 RepID=A0ABU2MSH3_9ACTN|nr:sugar phosphate isomerase/epimerase family protein [Streptomyces sp. DSM 44938]MDT0343554.1 sugar phosphate isomerase/epimerase family protein [Streptomyces sp. DSM 44938]